jgi:diadenosine tetraphosphate (Ap4A) HIT family hydrolase
VNEFVAEQCSFCREFGDPVGASPLLQSLGLELESRIVRQTAHFAVVPTIGQLLEGHLLILPKAHYLSFGHVPQDLVEEYLSLKQQVWSAVLAEYSVPPIMFEHGEAAEKRRAGGSVDHAHMHMVPTSADLLSIIRSDFVGRPIGSVTDLHCQAACGIPYLYYEDASGQSYVFDVSVELPSQYLRRLLAKQLGVSDRWNWRVFPEVERLRATVVRLEQVWSWSS